MKEETKRLVSIEIMLPGGSDADMTLMTTTFHIGDAADDVSKFMEYLQAFPGVKSEVVVEMLEIGPESTYIN